MKCSHCKKPFERTASDIRRGRTKYCSRNCWDLARAKRSKYRAEAVWRLGRKQCQMCDKTLPVENFHSNNKTNDGLTSRCRDCLYECQKSAIAVKLSENREKYLEQRKGWHLKHTFGIGISEYKLLVSKQNGVCAICRGKDKGRKLAIDHDHKTGQIRGLLCGRCNQGIGHFLEDRLLMRRAIEYLNSW